MKNKTISIFIVIMLFIYSCELDDLNSNNDPRDNIEDTWKIENETLKSLKAVYYVDIVKHQSDSTKVVLYNFHNLGENIYIVGTYNNNRITVSNFTTEGGFKINGTGIVSLKYKDISWDYSVDIGDGEPQEYLSTFIRIE